MFNLLVFKMLFKTIKSILLKNYLKYIKHRILNIQKYAGKKIYLDHDISGIILNDNIITPSDILQLLLS